MTTKPVHTYTIKSHIDYSSLEYDPDDPEPVPDGMFQYPIFGQIFYILEYHFESLGRQEYIFRNSNTFICYDPNNLNVRVAPDFYLAFDVDARAIMERKLYLPWEAGKPPDLVLEVGSESTGRQDTGPKRDIYARIGIGEYWRFDPTGGDYYGEPLVGEELVNGEYRRLEFTTHPDGVLKGYSRVLGLWLCWQDEMLTFYDERIGEYLPKYGEMQAALQEGREALHAEREALQAERSARLAEQEALQAERSARLAEQAARQQAEARIRELEDELRRRQ